MKAYTSPADRCSEYVKIKGNEGTQCMRRQHKAEHPTLGKLPFCTQHARLRGLLDEPPAAAGPEPMPEGSAIRMSELDQECKRLRKQWDEHCAFHGSESPHALQEALYRASDAESHCKALAEDRFALEQAIDAAVAELESREGTSIARALSALRAARSKP